MYIDNSFIASLLSQKDDKRIEKYERFEEQAVFQAVCAFLNDNGGWIIVGIDKHNQISVQGFDALIIDTIRSKIVETISPLPLVYVQLEQYHNVPLLLFTVLKGSMQPYTYRHKYYIKKNNSIVVPDKDDLNLLMRTSNTVYSSWEKSTTINAKYEDLDETLLNDVIEIGIKKGRLEQEMLPYDFFSSKQLLDTDSVKNGAVVLFADVPALFLPQCRIRIQVMMGGKTADKYEDTYIIDENLFVASKKVADYFKNRLPLVSTFSNNKWERIDSKKYPIKVIDEAVTNAMIHRDYGDLSGEIIIFIFGDRIEIHNSGQMPDHIVRGKNNIIPHISILRNPLLAEVFHIADKMEKSGRGMELIYNCMKEAGYKLPEWESKNGYTTLTLYSIPEKISINERINVFLHSLSKGESFSRIMYENFNNKSISEKTAKNDIRLMVEGEWSEMKGKGPSTTYVRTDKKLPDIS